MKKLLLSAICVATALVSQAAVSDYTKQWSADINQAVKDAKSYHAAMALDANANVIVAGAFTEDMTLADAQLTALGTSAYIAKYDNKGTAKWAVALTGSATVSHIATDAAGNIYVAGTFADEVEFGTTAGTAITKTGQMIDGAATVKQNSSFIAKYDADGKIVTVADFVANKIAELNDNPMYYPEDGDIFFDISDLKVVGDKVYVSAGYTGETKCGDTTFSASHIVIWGFMVWTQETYSVFSLSSSDLTGCRSIATVKYNGANGADEDSASEVYSCKFDVASDGTIYAAFCSVGKASLSVGENTVLIDEATEGPQKYTIAAIKDNALTSSFIKAWEFTATKPNDNSFAFVRAGNESVNLVGSMFTSTTENPGTAEAVTTDHKNIFVAKAPVATLEPTFVAKDAADGVITFNSIASVAEVAAGEFYLSTLGYYNQNSAPDVEPAFKNDEFANVARTFYFNGTEFAATAPLDKEAVGVAANSANVAFADAIDGGISVSLYNSNTSGISNITVSDDVKTGKAYNLQGIEVAPDTKGLIIIDGKKVYNK